MYDVEETPRVRRWGVVSGGNKGGRRWVSSASREVDWKQSEKYRRMDRVVESREEVRKVGLGWRVDSSGLGEGGR